MKAEIIKTKKLQVHAVVLFIFWGVLSDISILAVRFFKHIPYYLMIHTICGYAIFCATIAMVTMKAVAIGLPYGELMEVHFIIAVMLASGTVV